MRSDPKPDAAVQDAQAAAKPDVVTPHADPDLPARQLSPAAKRALAEAEARRLATKTTPQDPEVGGRGGADPARYGDWEINGRAIDF